MGLLAGLARCLDAEEIRTDVTLVMRRLFVLEEENEEKFEPFVRLDGVKP